MHETQRNLNGERSMKKSLSKRSESSIQFESPLRFHSPSGWDGAEPPSPEYRSPELSPEKPADNAMAIVAIDKLPQISPQKQTEQQQKPQENAPSSVTVFNRPDPPRPAGKVSPAIGGSGRRSRSSTAEWKTEEVVRKVALGFRLCEVVLCLISFSVMAADKTQGWSGDSFDRYKEYRYCLTVNIIAFAYSALQACDLTYQLVTEKHMISHHLRYHFVFFMDQVLAYLLISASSSAATRVDDWQSNWGKDEFTEMATVSIGMSFLSFVAFAMSSLISGYILFTRNSM